MMEGMMGPGGMMERGDRQRVADAVVLQDDMELVGICDIIHDYRIRVALEKGYRVFAGTSDKLDEMKAAGSLSRERLNLCWNRPTSLWIVRPRR